MNVLTKSYERSNALINTAQIQALRLKESGMLGAMSSPMSSAFSDMQSQSRSRAGYSQFRSWVYAAVNALCLEAAGQPVKIGRVEKESDIRKYSRFRTKGLTGSMTKNIRNKAAEREVELLPDHPLVDILEGPNPIQYRFQFVYSFVASLCLTGWGYVIRDEGEDGVEFYSLPSTWVRPDHKEGPFSKFYITNPHNPETQQAEPLTKEQVAFAYLPNPADPMGAVSPASSQMAAIRVDDRIQTCQERFFDNGIFPSVIVTVGKDPHPDVPGGGTRPRLTAVQRRQVMGAIRRVMGGIANYGNPAIVDGLIESITRLSATQPELGWDKSEDKLKTRILSAFCVHPFILGEPVGVGGYAQTFNIMDRFYSRVNVYLDLLSCLMTDMHVVIKEEKAAKKQEEESGKLLIWWEKKEAVDPSLRWQKMSSARSSGDISQNELRAELGMPPDEDKNESLISTSQASALIPLLAQVGAGAVTSEQAAALMKGMGIPDELAEEIAEGPEPPEEPAPQPPVGAVAGVPGAQGENTPEGQTPAVQLTTGPSKPKPPKPGRPGKKPPKQNETEQAAEGLKKAIDVLRDVPVDMAEQIATKIVDSLE